MMRRVPKGEADIAVGVVASSSVGGIWQFQDGQRICSLIEGDA